MLGVWAFTRFLKELTIMQEEKDNRGLKNFRRALLQVRAAIGPTIPTQLVQIFVDVALNEGKSLGELAELVGYNASTVSRHLLDLGERNRRMAPGYGDRKSVVEGKSVSVRVDLGGRRIIKNKKKKN